MTDGATRFGYISQLVHGDLVEDAETAIELAAVLIRHNWGDDTLKEQQPLEAREDGDCWWVEGTSRKSEVSPNALVVHVQIKKADASVASLYWTLPPRPGVSATTPAP